MTNFLQEAKVLVDQLALVGKPLSVAKFNVVIYKSLGANYHPIVVALSVCDESDSFHKLYGRLIAYEILVKRT